MKYFTVALLWVVLLFSFSVAAQQTDLTVTSVFSYHNVAFDEEGEATIRLTGLEAGDTYELLLIQNQENPVVAFSPVLPEWSVEAMPSLLRGVAYEEDIKICLDAVMPKLTTLRIGLVKNPTKQKKPSLTDKLASVVIQTEETDSIEFLLNTVFRKDTCFALTPGDIFPGIRRPRSVNGMFQDFFGQTGIFRNGMATIGIDSGIIITSGWVQDAAGPNLPSRPQTAPVDFFNTYNGVDEDADQLLPSNVEIYDLVVMDFDFVPTTDTISFNYVFFSEQYCDNLSGNDARDAFGFILTGPDGSKQNIARLPNSGDIVSPASLNPSTIDSEFFLFNTTPDHPRPCSPTESAPEDRLNGIGYDGFSTILTARGAVTPCAPHNLKIIVLDGNDALVDSGVFLEAGSFLASLVNKPEPNTTAEIEQLTPVEGCDSALIRFTRRTLDDEAINRPLFVKYNIIPILDGSLNEATRGTDPLNPGNADYILPESPFVIPAGDTSATLTIPILSDNVANEGIEAFVIRYDGTCDCSENADTFFIMDNVDLDIDLGPDQSACGGDEIILSPTIVGGNGTYAYNWPNGLDTSQVTLTATGRDTTVTVSITDACGLSGMASVTINAPDISATTGGTFPLCGGDVAEVLVDVEGASSYQIVLRVDSNGVVSETEYTITGDTIFRFTQMADISLVSVADAAGCGGSALGTARVRTSTVDLMATVTPDPCNQSLGAIDLQTTDGNGNFTFSWDDAPGLNSGQRSGLAAGTYNVSILRDGSSCPDNRSFTVTSSSNLSVSIRAMAPDCAGEDFVLSPIVSGGIPPYTFNWPDSSRTDSLLTVTSGTGFRMYMVEVTDSCGRMGTAAYTTSIESFAATVDGRLSLCNDDSVDLTVEVTGPAGSYEVVLNIDSAGIMTTRTVTLSPGLNSVPFDYAATVSVASIVRSSAGCSGDAGATTATIVDPQISFNSAIDNVRCAGETNGSIRLTTAATVPVTFTWSDGGADSPLRTNLAAGDYGLTITDTADPDCSRDTVITVTEPDPLSLTVTGGGFASCQGENIKLFPVVSGGSLPYSFEWDNGLSLDSLYQITTVGGVSRYPVQVTDACGIMVRDTVTISVSDTRAEVTGNYSVCNAPFRADVPFNFTGDGPFTFTIRENGAARTLVLSSGLDTVLTYTEATTVQLVSVTGSDGCPGTAGGIANVTDANFSVVPSVTDVLCSGELTGAIEVEVNGNNTLFNFTWSDPSLSGASLSGLAAGVYDLTITDGGSNGCMWDTSFVILEPATRISLLQDSTRDQTCDQSAYAAATYNGGTGSLTYTWSNGTTGPELGEVEAGLYELTITDENGCTQVQPFNLVDQRTTVLANIFQSASELSCGQPTLELTVAQNTQIVNWEWRNAAQEVVGNQRQLMVGTAGRYYVTVTNPTNGCFAVDSIDVVASDDLVTIDLPGEANITCINDVVDFTVTTDFTGSLTYEWTFNGAVVGTTPGLTNITATGTYDVKVTRTDNGCETFASIIVGIDREAPGISTPEPVVTSNCRRPEVTLSVLQNEDYNLSWSTADGNIVGASNTLDIQVDRPGTYRVIATDPTNGCTSEAFITVVNDGAILIADAGIDQALVCNGLGTQLIATFNPPLPGTEVIWFDPAGNEIGAETQVNTLTPGDHIVEVIHPESGCSSFDTVRVIDQSPTSVSYTLQQPPCPEVGGRLFVNNVVGLNGPFTYSSPTGETEPFGTGLRNLRVGSNVLEVTDQLGCVLRDSFLIFEGTEFTGTGDDVVITLGEEARLGVSTNRPEGQLASWDWINLKDTLACANCPDPTVIPAESFVAQVTVVDTNGCTVVIRQNVVVRESEFIYMPNAFSPNGDGVNDVYRVLGNQEFVDGINSFNVFDRWGGKVFEANDYPLDAPESAWDGGLASGRLAGPGVYTYNLSYRRFDGVDVVVTGSFTLVR